MLFVCVSVCGGKEVVVVAEVVAFEFGFVVVDFGVRFGHGVVSG